MTNITTEYEPIDRPQTLSALKVHEYFRIPEEQTVYKVLQSSFKGDVTVLNLDDLTLESYGDLQEIELVEINHIHIKVELL